MKFFRFAKLYLVALCFFVGIGTLQAAERELAGVSLRTMGFEMLADFDAFEERQLFLKLEISEREIFQQFLSINNAGKRLPGPVIKIGFGLYSASFNKFQMSSETLSSFTLKFSESGLVLTGQDSTTGFADRFAHFLYLYQKLPS